MMDLMLNQGQFAQFDDADLPLIAKYKWTAHKARGEYRIYTYIKVNAGRKRVEMARIIFDAPDHLEVDHINGTPLDNRRENLRLATRKQNCRNRRFKTSKPGLIGVYYFAPSRKYQAYIYVDNRKRHLGYFTTADDAAAARDKAALELYGEFAVLNNPNGGQL